MASSLMAPPVERRASRRVLVEFPMRCRTLGRGRVADSVQAIDLSAGGARFRGPANVRRGEMVLCGIDLDGADVLLKALVVNTFGHRDRQCDIHVAWTGLSEHSQDQLGRILVRAEWPDLPQRVLEA